MTIKFRCQPTQLGSWNEEKPRNAYAYDNYDYQSGHGFITVVAYVSMAVLVAALLIPFIPGMEVVKMKIFSWSLEPLCVIGVGWLLLFLNMEIPLDIVRSFMAGTLQAELAKAGFLPLWPMLWPLQLISCSGWSFTECFTGELLIYVPSSV